MACQMRYRTDRNSEKKISYMRYRELTEFPKKDLLDEVQDDLPIQNLKPMPRLREKKISGMKSERDEEPINASTQSFVEMGAI